MKIDLKTKRNMLTKLKTELEEKETDLNNTKE
jgi:hypothetical protein